MSNVYLRQGLSNTQQMTVDAELKKRGKDKTVMLLLWFFTSVVGGHRFYTRDTGYAVAMLFLGIFTLFIWNLVDVFFAWKRVDSLNEEIEKNIILEVKAYGETARYRENLDREVQERENNRE